MFTNLADFLMEYKHMLCCKNNKGVNIITSQKKPNFYSTATIFNNFLNFLNFF